MTHNKKQANELLRKYARPRVPFTRPTLPPSSTMEAVRRQKEAEHRKIQNSRVADAEERRLFMARQRGELTLARAELKKRLKFQSKHGDRVRSAVRNRIVGRRIVRENDENTKRIEALRLLIKRLERILL